MSQPHTAEQVAASIFYFTGTRPVSLVSIAHHDPDIMADRAGRALANEVVALRAQLSEKEALANYWCDMHTVTSTRANAAEAKIAALVAAGDDLRELAINLTGRIGEFISPRIPAWDRAKQQAPAVTVEATP